MRQFLLAVLAWSSVLIPPRQSGELTPGYWERTPLPQIGLATYYAAGTMDWVWSYRRQHGEVSDCPECVGAVALLRAGDIGRKVWLQVTGDNVASDQLAGPFLVVDCAHPDDIPALLERGWVVDVSYEVGQLWNMQGPIDGVVVWADPADDEAVPKTMRPAASYIDPSQAIVSAPTLTPVVPASPVLPTRLPGPLALTEGDAGQAGSASGATIITVPTPTIDPLAPTPSLAGALAERAGPAGGTPAAAAPSQAEQLLRSARPVPRQINVALGRPGSDLLGRPPAATRSPGLVPAYDLARPTSLPILAPRASPEGVVTPAGGTPAARGDPDQTSTWARLWQAFVELFGK